MWCHNRKCTDVLCMLLLIAVWFATTILGFIVCGVIENENLEAGNPWRLVNGVDYDGRVCGIDSGVKNEENIYYLPSGAGICIESCPTATDYKQFHCMPGEEPEDDLDAYKKIAAGKCMYHVATTDVFNYCIYDAVLEAAQDVGAATLEQAIAAANNGTSDAVAAGDIPESYFEPDEDNWFDDFTADLYKAIYVIFGFGIGVALGVGFLYLILLRVPGVLFLMTWGIIFLVQLLWLVGGALCVQIGKAWEDDNKHSDMESKGLLYFGYVLIAIGVLFFLFILCMRKRIKLAVGIVKEASKAISAMKIIVLFPVIQSLGVLCFLIPWVIYVVYLASSGEIVTIEMPNGAQVKQFQYTDNMRYAALFLLFSWFWTSQFVVALGQLVVAMAVSMWYFTKEKGSIGNLTVFKAIRVSMWYHSGTCAFGSLIIAIIKTIRAVISYLQKKAAQSGNKLAQAVLCCIQCCMWCLEKCMKFLNKNAYIQTAIYGYSFCKAARKAFFLIARNILRVVAVALVGNYILFIGKLVITVVTTFLAFLVLDSMEDELHGLYGPIIFTFLLAYFVALMFVEVFGMAIYTILQCFVADEEMFAPAERFATGDLSTTINKTNSDAKAAGLNHEGKGNATKVAPKEDGVV
uniref:Choline transporter-like protein n=1 Tax=Fibrocapsa japonica TaxID=94617 RepID=A0A7S2Y2B5_9STRA|mmetsp:Transcript_9983/g.15213  ORF Transcript_9983/g.15213 Transcript_9983/m.15213 type:complete len:633 (+) Transcript_9983:79-1977(+)